MSSALHAVLTALLWLSMALWPARALGGEPVPADGMDHVLAPHEVPAPEPGLVLLSEPCEFGEDDREDATTDLPDHAALRASLLDLRRVEPGASRLHGHATRIETIPLSGAGCIRGPPDTCPFGLVPKAM